MAVLGVGIGLFYPTATTVGVTAVDEARRSLAGAIIYMFQIAGGSVGLGLTTTVFIGASDRAQSGSGFIDGIQTAFTLDAAIAVGGFLIAAFLIQGRVHSPHLRRLLLAGPRPGATAPRDAQFGPGTRRKVPQGWRSNLDIKHSPDGFPSSLVRIHPEGRKVEWICPRRALSPWSIGRARAAG